MGTRGGADPQTLLDLLSTSWGTSFVLSRNGPVMMAHDFEPGRASLRVYVKDLDLVDRCAQEMGIPTPLASHTSQALEEAFGRGMGKIDVSSLIIPMEEKAGEQKPSDS